MRIHITAFTVISTLAFLLAACNSPSSNNSTLGNVTPSVSIQPPKVTLKLPIIPLNISLDLNGKISVLVRSDLKFPTPLGEIEVNVGGATLTTQDIKEIQNTYRGKRILIVRVDNKVTSYEIEKGRKFNVNIKADSRLFKEVNIANELSDETESIIVEIVSAAKETSIASPVNIPSNSSQEESVETPSTDPPINEYGPLLPSTLQCQNASEKAQQMSGLIASGNVLDAESERFHNQTIADANLPSNGVAIGSVRMINGKKYVIVSTPWTFWVPCSFDLKPRTTSYYEKLRREHYTNYGLP
jgi:hypothetical protein